jgi:hypothetical protein
VLRRTALLDAFFAPEQPPVPGRLLGWLLAQYLVQVASATRLPENLMEIRLPADATPNPSWLARFVDRHGPLPAPNLPACAEAMFARYAATAPAVRAYLSPAWEARFVQWLVQSAGADTAARLERAARASADAALIARVAAAVQAIGAASGAAVPGGPGGGANPAGRR